MFAGLDLVMAFCIYMASERERDRIGEQATGGWDRIFVEICNVNL